jgi:hypothetical protein
MGQQLCRRAREGKLRKQGINSVEGSAWRDSEVLHLSLYDLRYTVGTRLADAGVDIVKIAELIGQ